MWEWDLPRGQELRPNEATSAESWEGTSEGLETGEEDDEGEFTPSVP